MLHPHSTPTGDVFPPMPAVAADASVSLPEQGGSCDPTATADPADPADPAEIAAIMPDPASSRLDEDIEEDDENENENDERDNEDANADDDNEEEEEDEDADENAGAAQTPAADDRCGPISASPVDPPDPEVPYELDDRQRLALVSLARGSSISKASEHAGVGRTTLYRWMNQDGAFRAAYQRWKDLTRLSAHGQVLALQDLAVQVLREQLEFNRDARLAARLLEKTGVLAPPTIGPTHPGRAAAHLAAEQREQDAEVAERSANAERDGRYIPSKFRFTDSTKPPGE